MIARLIRGTLPVKALALPLAVVLSATLFTSMLEATPAAAKVGPHGVFIELPTQESEPLCRASHNRIVVVYAHPPNTESAPVATIRSIVRRMNWKISDQSSQSSSGTRAVKMVVDCTSEGAIWVHELEVPNYTPPTVEAALDEDLYGYPTEADASPSGTDAIKYLVFAPEGGEYGITENREGYAQGHNEDPAKSVTNKNATSTGLAVIGGGEKDWKKHESIHEMFHTLGAVYGGFSPNGVPPPGGAPPPPYSSYGGHCVDGIDVMCYEDGGGHGPWGDYTWTRCPWEENGTPVYGTPVKDPIDCGKDTYFNAAPQAGTWLAEYWDLAGPEDPFLAVAPTQAPEVSTGTATSIDSNSATIQATVTPKADYSTYRFEYGPTASYGSSSPMPEGRVPGYGNSPVNVSWQLSDLSVATTYHYRIVASNDAGKATPGADKTFTTTRAPVAITDQATVNPNEPTTATLKGRVSPNGLTTTYQFEYGKTTAYGSKVAIPAKDVTSGQTRGQPMAGRRADQRARTGRNLPRTADSDERRRHR